MKNEANKQSQNADRRQNQADDPARSKTNPPGQNPKQDDAPDHDVHHDENRRNPLAESTGQKGG